MWFFSGYEVYGYGNEINTNTILKSLPCEAQPWNGRVLGEQKGLETYLGAANASVIRVHPGYPYDTRKTLLAVTDRNIRFVFSKPLNIWI
jgi:hypothetical protein